MCIAVFIFIILAVFILTPSLESLTGMSHLKSKWVDLQGNHRVEMGESESLQKLLKTKKGDQIPPLIFKKGQEEKWDSERDVKRATTPSDNFDGEKPLVFSLPKSKRGKRYLKSDAHSFGSIAASQPNGYGFIKLTKKPIKGEAYSPAVAIIGFDENTMIRKKTNIPENIQREWDAEVYVKNKRKPASEDAWK